jgi:predicted glycoside hydrolase/deacetylase ChbG (UPF0249 family)
MMPCPWVPEVAAWCAEHPHADVGVHLTLTSEWRGYRWRPVSTLDPKSGLLDEDGYMWATVRDLHRHMDVDAAVAEMRAQVELALALGIDVTHVDTHMGAVAHPQLFPAYAQLAMEYRIPAMLPRAMDREIQEWNVGLGFDLALAAAVDWGASRGLPVLDYLCSAREEGDHLDVYRRLFDALPVGVTHLLLHPAVPGHDIETIAGSAPYRIADYETFMRPELLAHIAVQGIHLIGYRRLRDVIRGDAE